MRCPYYHVGVAAGYREAIEKGDIRTANGIDKMLNWVVVVGLVRDHFLSTWELGFFQLCSISATPLPKPKSLSWCLCMKCKNY